MRNLIISISILLLFTSFSSLVFSQSNAEETLSIEEIKNGIERAKQQSIHARILEEQQKIKQEISINESKNVKNDLFFSKVEPYKNLDTKIEEIRIALAAVCYEAAIQKCTAPLKALQEKFDFCIYGIERFYIRSLFKEYEIKDFPAMYLAYECGNDSLPILTKMLHSDSVGISNKIKAFFIMLQIDPVLAKAQFALLAEKGSENIEHFERVLALESDDSIKVWHISMITSDRMIERIKARKKKQALIS